MSYLDRYRDRVLRGATNIREKEKLFLLDDFEKYLNESPTAHELYCTQVNEFPNLETNQKQLMSVNDVSENDRKALDEKFLYTRASQNIEVGCYVFWHDNWWVIVSQDKVSLETYKKFTIRRCNQYFNYVYKGELYKIPVSIENMTLYSDGMADVRYISYGDTKNRITYGRSDVIDTIEIGTRMMISNRIVYRVTNLNDFEQNGKSTGDRGASTALVLQTAIIKEDDLENNIAYNSVSNAEIEAREIEGKNSINIGDRNTYSIEYEGDIEYILDGDSSVVLSQTGNKCYIKAPNNIDLIGESVLLIARDRATEDTINMKTIVIRGN